MRFPKIWVQMMLMIALTGVMAVVAVVLWVVLDYLIASVVVSVLAIVIQWYLILVVFGDVRPGKVLRERDGLLCPRCCYPVCTVHDDEGEEIVCPECGGRTTGGAILRAWMRVPEFRWAYRRHYH